MKKIKQDVSTNEVNEQQNKTFKYKKKPNIILIILVVVIALFALLYFMGGSTLNGVLNPNGNKEELKKIKVDTWKDWGDKFGDHLQDLFKEVDKFDLVFVDLELDNVPEAVVRYNDKSNNQVLKVYKIGNNKEISETKNFYNASLKLVYSSSEDNVLWYLFISSGKKYGSYTQLKKIVNNKALSADVKASNDKEIAYFNDHYIVSDYKVNFYEIKKTNFLEDYKVIFNRYEGANNDIKTTIDKMMDDNIQSKPEEKPSNQGYLTVGEFKLDYGDYVTLIPILEYGQPTDKTEKVIVTLNDNSTLIDGDKVIKYNVYNNVVSLENGISFKVIEDNKFVYGAGTGKIYDKVNGDEEF